MPNREGEGAVHTISRLDKEIEERNETIKEFSRELGRHREVLRRVQEMLRRKDSQQTISEYISAQRIV